MFSGMTSALRGNEFGSACMTFLTPNKLKQTYEVTGWKVASSDGNDGRPGTAVFNPSLTLSKK
jgi:hypothetical protein